MSETDLRVQIARLEERMKTMQAEYKTKTTSRTTSGRSASATGCTLGRYPLARRSKMRVVAEMRRRALLKTWPRWPLTADSIIR